MANKPCKTLIGWCRLRKASFPAVTKAIKSGNVEIPKPFNFHSFSRKKIFGKDKDSVNYYRIDDLDKCLHQYIGKKL